MKPRFQFLILTTVLTAAVAKAEVKLVESEFKLPKIQTVQKNESVYSTGQSKPKEIFKHIHQGDHELNPSLGMGYSSFSGVIFNLGVSYRHFVLDKIAIGLMGQYFYSDASRSFNLGTTARWYFAQTERWAFSLTQNLYFQEEGFNFPSFNRTLSSWKGTTGLGAHYFFTSNLNINFSMNYDYSLSPTDLGLDRPSLNSKVGFGINF